MDKRESNPPKLAERILSWFCSHEVVETLLGDLYEIYDQRTEELGERKANFYFFIDVFSACRPFAWKKLESTPTNHTTMFRYYVKMAWRSLAKQKMYTAIKIGGFSLGIAACFLIALFIKDELSYDTHYTHPDRIYRFIGVDENPGEQEKWPSFPAPIAEVLRNDFPEIEKVGRLIPYDWYDAGDNQFRPIESKQNTYEEGFVYADPELLEILEIPMVYGDQQSALAAPNSLVISKRIAEKYFPDEDPVGKLVVLNDITDNPYKVGGVMNQAAIKSHFQYDFVLTLTEKEFWEGNNPIGVAGTMIPICC